MRDHSSAGTTQPHFSSPKYAAGAIVATVLAAFLFEKFVAFAASMSWRVGGLDLGGDYLSGILWSIALGGSLLLWPVDDEDREGLLVLWAAKCLVCLGVMLIYENHYGLDAFNYYNSARDLRGSLDVELHSSTDYMVWLTSAHYRFIPSYHAIKTSYSYIGLIGVFVFYRTIVLIRPKTGRKALYLLGLWPTIIFWSSILGKDPIIFLGVALYCYGVAKWQKHQLATAIFFVLAGVTIASLIRVWFAVILAIPLVVLSLLHATTASRRVLTIALSAFILWRGVGALGERFIIESAAEVFQTTGTLGVTFGLDGGSSRVIGTDVGTLTGLASFLPVGMFSALFRPLPGEVISPFGLIASAENGLLVTLLLFAIARSRIRVLKDPLLAWAVALTLVWSGFYAVISYQNYGAALRFKLSIVPILLVLLIHLSKVFEERVEKRAGAV